MLTKKIFLTLFTAGLLALQANAVLAQTEETGGQSNEKAPVAELSKTNDLAGSWAATVSTAGAPAFKALLTFDRGGGLVASAQGDVLLNAPPGVAPVATAAHGAWERVGRRQYLFTLRQIYYDADGNFQGGAKIRNLGALDFGGDQLSVQFRFEWFDADGNVVFSGSGTMQATRIKAEPLTP